MDTNESILNLSDQIAEWLSQAPPYSDIEEYARHIPEEQVETIVWATRTFLDDMLARKNRELGKLFPGLIQAQDELDQLDALRLFAAYAPESVMANLKKADPGLTVPDPVPTSITAWAQAYTASWDSATLMVTVFDYLRRVVYAKTLVSLHPSMQQVTQWRSQIEELYLEDGKFYEQSGVLDQHEIRKMTEALKALRFLPEQFIARVVLPEGDLQRFHLLDDMRSVFALAEALGEEEVYKGEDGLFYLAVWRQMKLAAEEEFLVAAEAARLDETPRGKSLESFFTWLNKTWTVEALQSGQVPAAITSYVEKLGPADASVFDELFTTFLENSAVVAMVIRPVDPPSFVAILRRLTDFSQVNEYAEETEERVTDPLLKPLAHNLVTMASTVFDQLKRHIQQIAPPVRS